MYTVANANLEQYKALASAIDKSDARGLRARWDFGRKLLLERKGKKLPDGLLGEVAKYVGKSVTLVKCWKLFAQKTPTEADLQKLIADGRSWHEVVRDFGMDREARQERRREEKRAKNIAGLKVFNGELPDNLARVECAKMEEFLTRPWLRGQVDAIITDPPYDKGSIPLYAELARLAKDCLKPDGILAVMPGTCFLPEVLAGMTKHMPFRWQMAYVFPHVIPSLGNDRKVNKIGYKPVLVFGGRSEYISDTVLCESGRDDKAFHKWGQSLDGFKQLVDILTLPGQLVVDPFMGAGTTGLAALTMKRRFAGCDIDKEAFEIAKKRLGAAVADATETGLQPEAVAVSA